MLLLCNFIIAIVLHLDDLPLGRDDLFLALHLDISLTVSEV